MPDRIFGQIPGVEVGATYVNRDALALAKVHRPLVTGISGSKYEGSDSVVLSGGYEDDEDFGDVVVYTGHGGNDPSTGKQIADQEWIQGNHGLRISQANGLPVRVTRGSNLDSEFAPAAGYRYDGLYYVEDSWQEPGISGFQVCRFRLVRDDPQPAPWASAAVPPTGNAAPSRVATTVQRIVRSSKVINYVKKLHDFHCQICSTRLCGPTGPYAEGAHIRPLGTPHDGPDVSENVLCLCPNCHVLFDLGAITIAADLSINGLAEARTLRTVVGHSVSAESVDYHRQCRS